MQLTKGYFVSYLMQLKYIIYWAFKVIDEVTI